ncbi:MAG: hypothetical protein RKH07_00890 [Gammaproteobacteria bacterium]
MPRFNINPPHLYLGTALCLILSSNSLAQDSATEDIPRLANGRPDLQGTWDFRTITPLQRPEQYGDRETLSADEAEEFEVARQEQLDRDNFTDTSTTGDYNEFWYDRGNQILGSNRTSLITNPPNGRLPEMTEAAQNIAANAREAAQLNLGVEVRPLSERCIMGFNSGPPMLPSAYNNNVQLVQTDDHVVIHNEMVHNARIVKMYTDEHLDHPRKWEGDSIGYWEGDTLVIETRHFAGATSFLNSSENMELIERFWMLDSNSLGYEFTITDPSRWTQPWTAMFPMVRTDEPIYEYACHEGNYSMPGIMAGWRRQEVEAEFNAQQSD